MIVIVLQWRLKTGELDAAKNEINSVPKFHLSQSKHLTSQYIVAVHSVQNEKTAHVERGPPWKIFFLFNKFLNERNISLLEENATCTTFSFEQLNPTLVFLLKPLGGLESFITMIGHRFPKFYNASLYAKFLKCNFWKQKLRMSYKVLCIHMYSKLISGLFSWRFTTA
jgi:hypothetical protein